MNYYKKLFLTAVLFFGLPLIAQAESFYIPDDAITIDNTVTEEAWGDPIISDGEDDPDRTTYCWNSIASDWDELTNGSNCATYLYDEEGQIDILEAWFGVNETNMLLAFETATAMFAIQDMSTNEYVNLMDFESLQETGIDHLPNSTAFDHDMVFAFDTNPVTGEETYDWYMVANIEYDIPMDQNQDTEGFLQIYQEDGTTNGFQDAEDTFIDNIDTNNSEAGTNEGSEDATAVMEIRQNIEYFYETTGMSIGDEVGFRLETHSLTGDTTEPVLVTFVDAEDSEDSEEDVVEEDSALDVPTSLQVKNRMGRSVKLTWSAIEGAKTYKVELKRDNGKEVHIFKQIRKNKKTIGKGYLKGSLDYTFRVRACPTNQEKATSGCSDWSEYKDFRTKPLQPNQLEVIANADGTATLSWNKRQGKVKRFVVKVYNEDGTVFEKVKTTTAITIIDGLTPGSTYYYRARSIFNSKNRSNFSSRYSFTVPQL